jgi:SAM-dependent methyltransferase
MKTSSKPHWQDRRRYVSNSRMAWYGEPGDEYYWYEYWKARLTSDYYTSAEKCDLTTDELGKIILKAMSPGGLHLEAGCGAGYWVAALRHYELMIEGIEYSPKLVDLVHSVNPQLPIRQGNALHIDCPDNYYDTYLSIGVVEHRIEGPEPFLSEAYRVLKPGGKILISVPYFGPIRRLKSHLSLYERKRPDLPFFQYGFTRKEFTNFLQSAGFSIEEILVLYTHRLLLEEVALYWWASNQSWSRFVRKWAELLLRNKEGHMLLVVGQKPANNPWTSNSKSGILYKTNASVMQKAMMGKSKRVGKLQRERVTGCKPFCGTTVGSSPQSWLLKAYGCSYRGRQPRLVSVTRQTKWNSDL